MKNETEIKPLMVNTKAAATLLGISTTSLHYLLRDGRLPRVKLGRRTLIAFQDIEAFLDSLNSPSHAIHRITPRG